MKTTAWSLIVLILAISCTADDSDPSSRKASIATIDTFAGTTFGYSGDGGQAKAAQLGWINGLAIDTQGNLYIADGGANVIRKVNTSGVISTAAGVFPGFNVSGSNIVVYAGDGGPATAARLNVPLWVAVDPAGNFYINDAANFALRKVNTSGIINTIAGGREVGFKVESGPASGADFNNPYSIVTDATGNLYIADAHNHIIRKIAPDGNISIVAGIAKQGGYSGDGGPATSARLYEPRGIAIDSDGTIYITDNQAVIRKISSGVITTIAGTGDGGFAGDGGPAIDAKLMGPQGIAIMKDGSLVVADAGNNRIRRITKDGNIDTIAGTGSAGYTGDGGPAEKAQISNPQGIVVDRENNIYVAESGNAVIRIITLNN